VSIKYVLSERSKDGEVAQNRFSVFDILNDRKLLIAVLCFI